jgi:hypothetical protein
MDDLQPLPQLRGARQRGGRGRRPRIVIVVIVGVVGGAVDWIVIVVIVVRAHGLPARWASPHTTTIRKSDLQSELLFSFGGFAFLHPNHDHVTPKVNACRSHACMDMRSPNMYENAVRDVCFL